MSYKNIFFFIFSLLIVAGCATKSLKEYQKEVYKKAEYLYKKRYKKWKCPKLVQASEKIEGRLDSINDKIDKDPFNEGLKKRKINVQAHLAAIETGMDTCDEDDEKKNEKSTIHNENNININNNR